MGHLAEGTDVLGREGEDGANCMYDAQNVVIDVPCVRCGADSEEHAPEMTPLGGTTLLVFMDVEERNAYDWGM